MNHLLAQLNLPGGYPIDGGPVASRFPIQSTTLGSIISSFIPLVLYFAVFFAFVMLIWASLRWIFSGGNKEAIAKARARITYAIIGLIITFIALFISNFIKDSLRPSAVSPIKITSPSQQTK